MKKNAIYALILAVSMTAAMTSCGPKEEISNGTEQPSYNEAMGIDDKTEEKEEEVVIEPTQEILDAELADNKVQLGTHVYQFPIPLQKLLDDGAVITNDADPVNDVLEKRESGGNLKDVEFIIDEKKYTLTFSTPVDFAPGRIQLKDCFANDPDYDFSKIDRDIIYAKGIKVGSTVDELKRAWGEPTEDNLDKLVYTLPVEFNEYKAECRYEINIDLESQTINTIIHSQYIAWTPKVTEAVTYRAILEEDELALEAE